MSGSQTSEQIQASRRYAGAVYQASIPDSITCGCLQRTDPLSFPQPTPARTFLTISVKLVVVACQSLAEIDLHHQLTLPVSQCEFSFRSIRIDTPAGVLWDSRGGIYPHPFITSAVATVHCPQRSVEWTPSTAETIMPLCSLGIWWRLCSPLTSHWPHVLMDSVFSSVSSYKMPVSLLAQVLFSSACPPWPPPVWSSLPPSLSVSLLLLTWRLEGWLPVLCGFSLFTQRLPCTTESWAWSGQTPYPIEIRWKPGWTPGKLAGHP